MAPNSARFSAVKAVPPTSNVPLSGRVAMVMLSSVSPSSISVKFKSAAFIVRSVSSGVDMDAALATSSDVSSGVSLSSITCGASLVPVMDTVTLSVTVSP